MVNKKRMETSEINKSLASKRACCIAIGVRTTGTITGLVED